MRTFALLLALAGWIGAHPPSLDTLSLYLNREGLILEIPPAEEVDALRRKIGARRVSIEKGEEGVGLITFAAALERRVTKVGSSADLRSFFQKSECIVNWDLFDACRNRRKNPKDELLVRKIDEGFIRKLIGRELLECSEKDSGLCLKEGEGASPSNPSFPKWRLRWQTPAIIRIEAAIGEPGGFGSLEEARASLHRINLLLKKVLYGARFPESAGEERTPDEVYWTESRIERGGYDYAKALDEVLKTLENGGYLCGLLPADREEILSLAEGGRLIYYLSPQCAAETKEEIWTGSAEEGYRRIVKTAAPGWRAVSGNADFSIDEEGCPHYRILR